MTQGNVIGERPIAMPTTRLNKREKEWRAEEDANTLARAKLIVNDPGRLTAAKSKALQMAEADKVEATALDEVSKLKPNKPLRDVVATKVPVRRRPKPPNPNPHNVFKKI